MKKKAPDTRIENLVEKYVYFIGDSDMRYKSTPKDAKEMNTSSFKITLNEPAFKARLESSAIAMKGCKKDKKGREFVTTRVLDVFKETCWEADNEVLDIIEAQIMMFKVKLK